MASYEDIHIDQGAEFTAEVTVQKDNLDFDLTGYTYAPHLRQQLLPSAKAQTQISQMFWKSL